MSAVVDGASTPGFLARVAPLVGLPFDWYSFVISRESFCEIGFRGTRPKSFHPGALLLAVLLHGGGSTGSFAGFREKRLLQRMKNESSVKKLSMNLKGLFYRDSKIFGVTKI